MAKCSIDVPKHFLDGKTEVSGGVQEADVKDALRWAADGKAVILDATVKPAATSPETVEVAKAKPVNKGGDATP